MARARTGQGWVLATVIVGIGFFFSLVLAILFYTQVSKAEADAAKATAELNRVARLQELAGPEVRGLQLERGESVVGHLLNEVSRLKNIIYGSSEATTEQINQEMSRAGIVQGGTLLAEVNRLNREVASREERITDLQEQARTAQQQAATARQEVQTLSAAHNDAINALRGELGRYAADIEAHKKRADDARAALERQLADVRSQTQQQVTQQQARLAELEAENEQFRRKIADAGRSRGEVGVGTVDPSLLPDGRIASIAEDENLVYIDRGRRNQIVLGMTFEVYDRATSVVKSEFGEIRGKATIEVTNVMENASVARVVRREPRTELAVGDVIANLVYDPNLSFKFYVYGDFDIDNVGQTTSSDRRRIESMIAQWGGRVVSARDTEEGQRLTYDVDFLVLGQEPPVPEQPSDELDPREIERFTRERRRYETYQNLIAQARELSIPVVNQNRFLTMVGYYRR